MNGISCLTTRLTCGAAATSFANISVQDSAGAYLTDQNTASFGFGIDMSPCTSFPSRSCPFRFETQWRSVCNITNSAFCNSPQLKVKGILSIDESFKPINYNMYSFEITLGQVLGTYEQSCTSLGGTYYPGNPPRCELPMAGNCGVGEIVVGYNKAAKTKTCKPYFLGYFNGIVAPPNTVIVGVNGDGSPNIKPIKPQTAPFPAQLMPSNPGSASPYFGGGGGGSAGGAGGGGCGAGDGC